VSKRFEGLAHERTIYAALALLVVVV